jgi:hypothetical protein
MNDEAVLRTACCVLPTAFLNIKSASFGKPVNTSASFASFASFAVKNSDLQKQNACAIIVADDNNNSGACRLERVENTMYKKEIVYDAKTRDFAMYLDGELVGFARTYQEAEVTLDQLVFELMSGNYFREAA